jgi:phosphatidylglycerol:prolipoprotein diacylglycerol transferase
MVAIGMALGLYVVIRLSKAHGIEAKAVTDMAFYTVILAIAGSRLGFVLLEPAAFLEDPILIFKLWEGGLVFSFGLVVGVITLLVLARKKKIPFFLVGDTWAPGLALGQAIGRIGCFLAGCCYGIKTDSWCAVTFTDPNSLAPLGVPLYPTQLFHSAANFTIFIVLLLINRKKQYTGQVLVWYMILHPIQRLFIEKFRGDYRGTFLGTDFTTTQALSLLVLFAGVVLQVILKRRAQKHV